MTPRERDSPNLEKWCKLLSLSEGPNLIEIVVSAFAIPVCNDYLERVFNFMNNLKTDERYRLRVEMVKAELAQK